MTGRCLTVWVALALMDAAGCRMVAGYDPAGRDAGAATQDGRPPQSYCAPPAALADTQQPDAVVGAGTKASCTADELIKAVSGGGVITFDCGSEPHTIVLTAPLMIEADTTLDGEDLIVLGGGRSSQIVQLRPGAHASGPHLRLQRLTLRDGRGAAGGAIEQHGGALTVVGCRFEDNAAESGWGGAIFAMAAASTTIVDSVFLRNVAGSGGAIGVLDGGLRLSNSRLAQNAATSAKGQFPGFGGAVAVTDATDVELCRCRLENNKASRGGGALYSWAPSTSARTEIAWSTVVGNRSEDFGGGLWFGTATVLLRQSLVNANRASSSGGGVFVTADSASLGVDLIVRNVTVVENRAPFGAGLRLQGKISGVVAGATIVENAADGDAGHGSGIYGGSQAITLRGSIIAHNTVVDDAQPINCTALLADGGGNFQFPLLRADGSSDDPGALCAATVRREAPELSPLAYNGGPTETVAPLPKSPVIGASESCLPTDQRGEPRSTPCTSGAYEP